jgi:hypothetical protein
LGAYLAKACITKRRIGTIELSAHLLLGCDPQSLGYLNNGVLEK